MTNPLARRVSRRSFLKLGAAAVTATVLMPLPNWPAAVADISPLQIKSSLPLPRYPFLPFPEQLLSRKLDDIDVALVPAYVAAQLIQRGLLQTMRGQPGRAHDPEGRYTLPFAYRVAALRFPSEAAVPRSASWSDLWSAADRAAWPAFGRVITGAALLRRGYSPNDLHSGHLAQAAADLACLNPRIVPDLFGRSQTLQTTDKPLALVLADPAALGQPSGLRLPVEGTMLVEYDWVITACAARAAAAREFVNALQANAQPPRSNGPARLIPLMPLPDSAQSQHIEIWASLTGCQSSKSPLTIPRSLAT